MPPTTRTLPPVRLCVEPLECRITPVIGKFDLAPVVEPGAGFDGVIQVTTPDGGSGTGSLLATGRHILTAAHVVANDAGQPVGPITIGFDMPNVGRINIQVPVSGIAVHPDYATLRSDADLAVLTLPVLAPSGPLGVGAERYDLYRATDELGRTVTVVGYGRRGSGTTGELTDPIDRLKRMARNRYDALGEQVGVYRPGTSLLYDVDNGSPANDAFGRILGVNDLGLADEGTAARGDSGGPVFVTVNGRFVIAGTTTTGPKTTQPPNPAELNPAVDAGFGSISQDSRMSTFAPFIDGRTGGAAELVLDLRSHVVGQDAVADAIEVRLTGTTLELLVNGTVYHSTPLAGVTSLKLVGAGEGDPFTTTATIQNGVPLALVITYERILQVADNRTATNTNPPANAPTLPAAPTPTAPDIRPAPVVDLGNFPNLLTPSLLFSATGGGRVKVFDPQAGNKVVLDLQPFAGYNGPLTTAFGDVTGDLVKDLVVAAGPGGGPHVKVFDGVTFAEVRNFFAYDAIFRGGVSVSAGDVTGDGVHDIFRGAGAGGGPHVKVFDGATGAIIRNFFAYDSAFRGGVSVAAGDTNDDGFADIVTGAGAGGGPHIKVFDGQTNAVIRSFFAYAPSFTGGVSVAAGDIDGDGSLDIITGAGAGGGPHVKVFNSATGNEQISFFAYDPSFTGGVSVAALDADNDGLTDIVTGAGAGGGPHVKVLGGDDLVLIRSLFAFDPTATFGAYVGGQG